MAIDHSDLAAAVRALIETLEPVPRQVTTTLLGLDPTTPPYLKYAADRLGISQTEVKRQFAAAITKMRQMVLSRSNPFAAHIADLREHLGARLGVNPDRRVVKELYDWAQSSLSAGTPSAWALGVTRILDQGVSGSTKHRRRYHDLVEAIRTEVEKGDPDLPVHKDDHVVERMISRACFDLAHAGPPAMVSEARGRARTPRLTPGVWKGNSRGGIFESSRPGYGGVRYESQLEGGYVEALDRSFLVAWYQEQPGPPITYSASGRSHTHVPDFLVRLNDDRVLLVEIKPILRVPTAETLRRAIVARRHAHRNGWGYVLMTENWRGLRDLRQTPLTDVGACNDLAWRVRSAGVGVTWAELGAIQAALPKGSLSLAAFCIQHAVMVLENPWRLQKVPDGFEWTTLFPDTFSNPH